VYEISGKTNSKENFHSEKFITACLQYHHRGLRNLSKLLRKWNDEWCIVMYRRLIRANSVFEALISSGILTEKICNWLSKSFSGVILFSYVIILYRLQYYIQFESINFIWITRITATMRWINFVVFTIKYFESPQVFNYNILFELHVYHSWLYI